MRTTDERPARRLDVGRGPCDRARGRRPSEPRILGEDPVFERAQLGSGLDAELFDEHVAGVLVRAQRVGLPARPVEGEHEQLAEPLANRVLLGQPLGLDRDRRVTTALEVDRELGFERDDVQVLQALALGLRPRFVRDVRERLAPPQGEGIGEEDAGVVEPAELLGLDRRCDIPLEPHGIDLFGRDVEDVPGRAGDEDARRRPGSPVRFERPSQVRHVRLQRRRGRGRWLTVPELVDEPVDGDDPTRLEQEQREEGAVLGRAEVDRAAFGDHGQRARAARTRDAPPTRRTFSSFEGRPKLVVSRPGPSETQGRVRTFAVMPDSELPGDVRATIERRVDLLAEDTRRMLAAASVLGRRFDLTTLAATTRIDPDVVTAALAEAVAAEVIVDEGDGYLFAHALVEDTLYRSLPPTRRLRLHRAAAEAYERLAPTDPPLATIAFHYCRALPAVDRTRAVEYARRAGAEAAERGASEQAVQHYERARDGGRPRRRSPVALRARRFVRRGRPARARTGRPTPPRSRSPSASTTRSGWRAPRSVSWVASTSPSAST